MRSRRAMRVRRVLATGVAPASPDARAGCARWGDGRRVARRGAHSRTELKDTARGATLSSGAIFMSFIHTTDNATNTEPKKVDRVRCSPPCVRRKKKRMERAQRAADGAAPSARREAGDAPPPPPPQEEEDPQMRPVFMATCASPPAATRVPASSGSFLRCSGFSPPFSTSL